MNNASDKKEFTQRYQSLLNYYQMAGEKIQAGHGNENGDIEQRHHRFKQAADQALMLRGSRDFASRLDYDLFLKRLLGQLNAGRRERLAEELAKLRSLPARRLEACKRLRAKVDSGSLIHVERLLKGGVPPALLADLLFVMNGCAIEAKMRMQIRSEVTRILQEVEIHSVFNHVDLAAKPRDVLETGE